MSEKLKLPVPGTMQDYWFFRGYRACLRLQVTPLYKEICRLRETINEMEKTPNEHTEDNQH